MHTYYEYFKRIVHEFHIQKPVGLPKPKHIIGCKRHYHNSTIPPLDFRSCSDAQFDKGGSSLPNWVINMVHLATVANVQVRLDERAR